MNEKIFRGKREDGKGWVQSGNIIQFLDDGTRTVYMPHFTDRCDAAHEEPYDNVISIACKGDSRFYSIIPETVGQFTGLIVANGKVFDGDYLKFGAYILEVFWNGESFKWQAGKVGRSYDTPFRCCGEFRNDEWNVIDIGEIAAEPIITGQMTTEIIGNRWDNPELIPKKTKCEWEF